MYKRCSKTRKCLTKVVDFVGKKCSGFTGSTDSNEEVITGGDVVKKRQNFYILGDVLSSGGGEQEAVTARI